MVLEYKGRVRVKPIIFDSWVIAAAAHIQPQKSYVARIVLSWGPKDICTIYKK